MSLKFIGMNGILEKMMDFEHLYKSDVNLDIKCIFCCSNITHEQASLLEQAFERYRAEVIEDTQILSKNNQINYIHKTNYEGILGVDLVAKDLILPDNLGEVVVETDQSKLEEIVFTDNKVTIACIERKYSYW